LVSIGVCNAESISRPHIFHEALQIFQRQLAVVVRVGIGEQPLVGGLKLLEVEGAVSVRVCQSEHHDRHPIRHIWAPHHAALAHLGSRHLLSSAHLAVGLSTLHLR